MEVKAGVECNLNIMLYPSWRMIEDISLPQLLMLLTKRWIRVRDTSYTTMLWAGFVDNMVNIYNLKVSQCG